MNPQSNANLSAGRTSTYAIAVIFSLILISPLFSLPRPSNVSSIPWKVELLFSLFLVPCVLLLAFRTRRSADIEFQFSRPEIRTTLALIGAFALWSAVSVTWAASWTAAGYHTLLWANYAVVLALVYILLRDKSGVSKVLVGFSVLSLIIGALCIFDFVTLEDFSVQEGTIRIRYAKYAELLITLAPLLFADAIFSINKKRFVATLIAATLAWLAVMLSLSKGAFISGTIGFVVFFIGVLVFSPRRYRKNALILAGFWLVFTIAIQIGFSVFTQIPSTTDYISGESDASRTTSSMRAFTWKVAREMIASNPVSGVGADNFGLAFNFARRDFAVRNPSDGDTAIGEDYIFERAHNEPIQILAELGIIGFGLFATVFLYTAYFSIKALLRFRSRLSPMFIGSLAGIAAFLISSLFSSFSFRAFQNGIVFFIVLAVALNEVSKLGRHESPSYKDIYGWKRNRFAIFAVSATIPLLLAIFSFSKAVSQNYLYNAERTEDLSTAEKYLDKAAMFDPDNPGAYLAHAERLAKDQDWKRSAEMFRRAIDGGLGISVTYSFLANAQEKAGDLNASENTLAEGISIFPRSAFLRARYALTLEKNGKPNESAREMEIARAFDERQANGWYAVIKDGILNAHIKAKSDPATAAPPDLLPSNAIYAYADEPIGTPSPK